MFGYTIIKKDFLEALVKNNKKYFVALCRIDNLERQLNEAKAENKRLFDYHNKKLTAPKRDKRGVLRNPDGTFAKRVK